MGGDLMTEDARAAWCAAFVKAQSQFVNPPKTERVSTGKFSYSYAALPDIIDSVRQVLHENGLAVAQAAVTHDGGVGVSTAIYHTAGHSEYFGPLLLPTGSNAQEVGSALTYARRYALCAALGIAAEDDDGGAAASKKSGPVSSSGDRRKSSPSGAGPGTTSPADLGATPGEGDGVLGKDAAPSARACDHKDGSVTDLKADGKTQMPKGWLRRTCCGLAVKESDVV